MDKNKLCSITKYERARQSEVGIFQRIVWLGGHQSIHSGQFEVF